jgi:ligand-binding SRPBCC domain-containing protein
LLTGPSDIAVATALHKARVVQRSRLAATPSAVWERISSADGINAELKPIAAIAFPDGWEGLNADCVTGNERLFRCRLLLFGAIPIDLHDFRFLIVEPGHGFVERSSSLLHREWIHERVLSPARGGTDLTDRVYYQCRVPALGMLLRPIFRAIFRHRHRQLRRFFGVTVRRDANAPLNGASA